VSAEEAFGRAVANLGAVVGNERALSLLERRLNPQVNLISLLKLSLRVDILLRYAESGDPVKKRDVDNLVEQQASAIILAHVAAIKTELGLS
jgi:hypothetical protein